MKKVKVLLAALLSTTVVWSMGISSYAATSEVKIEVKATEMENVSVTVPSTIPIVFNADGTTTLPTNWKIENKSPIAGIHLSRVDMDGSSTDWKLLAASENAKELAVNTKTIQFSMGKAGALKVVAPAEGIENSSGFFEFEKTDISIPSGESQILSFEVGRAAFTQTEASAKAFNMILTFEFN